MSEQRLEDIATLARSPLLGALPPEEIGHLLSELTPVELSEGGVLEPAQAMHATDVGDARLASPRANSAEIGRASRGTVPA